MQNEQQRLGPCRTAGPADKPPRVDDGSDDQNHACRTEIGKNSPDYNPRAKQADRRAVNGTVSRRLTCTVTLEQPVAREARNDAPAYHRDQQDRRRQSEAPAESARYGHIERLK